jgi:hypothetical protein
MATLQNYLEKLVNGGERSLSFSAAGTVSTALDVIGSTVFGFYFPPTFTGSNITFEVSVDGENFYTLKDGYSGNAIQITAVAGDYSRVLPADFVGFSILRLVCASAQADANDVIVACGPLL